MEVKHKCKDNDAVLKFIIEDGEIDEIWLQDPTSKNSWFVIGYEDLLEGIEKAKTHIPLKKQKNKGRPNHKKRE